MIEGWLDEEWERRVEFSRAIQREEGEGPREVGSKPNRAEQKQRQNVIENPLRRSGEKSREGRGTTRGVGGTRRQRRQRIVVGFSPHSAGPLCGYILRAHSRANTFDR